MISARSARVAPEETRSRRVLPTVPLNGQSSKNGMSMDTTDEQRGVTWTQDHEQNLEIALAWLKKNQKPEPTPATLRWSRLGWVAEDAVVPLLVSPPAAWWEQQERKSKRRETPVEERGE